MPLRRLIKNLSMPLKALKYKSLQGINSRKEFYRIIDRERDRANRNNHHVSLIVFNLQSFPDNGKERKLLIKNIIEQKRKVDELGWYDKHSVGVILPYTPSRGARQFSVRLSRTLNFIMPDSFCYLFTYPLENKTDTKSGEDKVGNVTENGFVVIKNQTTEPKEDNPDDFVRNPSARSV